MSYGLLTNTSYDDADRRFARDDSARADKRLARCAVGERAAGMDAAGFNDASWSSSAMGTGVGSISATMRPPACANGTMLPDGLIGFDLTDAGPERRARWHDLRGGPPNWPAGEEPPQALDNTTTHEVARVHADRGVRTAFTLPAASGTPSMPTRSPRRTTRPIAIPMPGRFSGSNDGVNFTQIDTRTAQTFTEPIPDAALRIHQHDGLRVLPLRFQDEVRRDRTAADRPDANAIQMAEIELFARGPVDFTPLDRSRMSRRPMLALKTSVYQRVEFNVADPASLLSLSLEMQYDDGFIVYLNGKRVAAANAPSAPRCRISKPTRPASATTPLRWCRRTFNLTPHLGELVAGTNVLAIHVLNVNDASEDLLSQAAAHRPGS